MNENDNASYQNFLDAAKAVVGGKVILLHTYIKKQEKSQVNNLTLCVKEQQKEEQKEPKVSGIKEIIQIRSVLPGWLA